MITIRVSTYIQRPIDDVYAYLGCYENDVHWRTGVVAMKQSLPGTAMTGMKIWEVIALMGRKAILTAEIIAAEPNRRTAFRSVDGPVKARGLRLFETHSGGTHFTYKLSLKANGMMDLLLPVVGYVFRRQLTKDLLKLKQQLEIGER
jgi:uncharacterized membrane protein